FVAGARPPIGLQAQKAGAATGVDRPVQALGVAEAATNEWDAGTQAGLVDGEVDVVRLVDGRDDQIRRAEQRGDVTRRLDAGIDGRNGHPRVERGDPGGDLLDLGQPDLRLA